MSQAADGPAQRLQRAWLRRGPLALALLPLAGVFWALAAIRRGLYRYGWCATQALPVPVVVVGNLIVGGAGKTPTVMAVVRLLQEHGYHPGIISRGYCRAGDSVLEVTPHTPVATAGDEPLLLCLATGAPVVVGRDRVAAAREMLRRYPEVDLIVSDDGRQHLRLPRTAQVLVFDERGVGNGWPLPAGPLREPLPRVLPDRTVVIYNAPEPSTLLAGSLARRSLRPPVALADWRAGQSACAGREGAAGNGPGSVAGAGDGGSGAFSTLAGRPLIAAAGLARPERFFEMLRQAGLSFTPLPLADHFGFAALPWPAGPRDVLVTEKDAVKLDQQRLGETRVWVVGLDFQLDPAFETALLALLPPSRRPFSPPFLPSFPSPITAPTRSPPPPTDLAAEDGNPTS